MLVTRLRQPASHRHDVAPPDEVVSWLGAVQAQDYAGADVGGGAAGARLTAAAIERAFAAGRILRTHVLRQTWHFVAQADIRWMQALTGPRVLAASAYHAAKLEIDARLYARPHHRRGGARAAGDYLTRNELADGCARRRIDAAGQRLAYIVMAPSSTR